MKKDHFPLDSFIFTVINFLKYVWYIQPTYLVGCSSCET